MDTDYMKIFSDIFYDVEKDKEMMAVIKDSCNLLGSVIVKYGEVLNEMRYKQSEEKWWVDIVIMLFVRKVMEHLDSINLLVEKCAFTQAEIILRTLLETTVGVRFILKEETAKRAAAYYLYHHYEEMNAISNLDDSTIIGKKFKDVMGAEKFNKVIQKCIEKREALKRLIKSNSIFSEIDEIRNKKLKKSKYVSWYGLCSNVTSFKGMMEKIGWGEYYNVVYSCMSMEVHSFNAAMEMISADDGLHMKLVRHPLNGFDVIDYASVFAFSALIDIYKYLKDGKNEKKEFEEYRYSFDNMKARIEKKFIELSREGES